MNGANVGLKKEFNRLESDRWMFGVLNAIPFLAGGLL
jgi:hypothetical protein